ncbi:methylated-DNA--[protein]-cysteine S-methyltransferase [Thermosulfuriphilus sp.]
MPPEEALADLLFEQLRIYLSGRPVSFEIPLDLRGSSFQEIVWRALREIPFGATITYGQLACRIGRPRAARAVGMALAQNPVPILVPCHRVVAKGGLGGFSGGLELKRFLLNLEGVFDEPIPELPDLPLGS